jgi:hypothetical protein
MAISGRGSGGRDRAFRAGYGSEGAIPALSLADGSTFGSGLGPPLVTPTSAGRSTRSPIVQEGKISASDLEIFQLIDEPSEIVRAIKKTVIV